eukprot:1444997-Amphidinium_carterae.1
MSAFAVGEYWASSFTKKADWRSLAFGWPTSFSVSFCYMHIIPALSVQIGDRASGGAWEDAKPIYTLSGMTDYLTTLTAQMAVASQQGINTEDQGNSPQSVSQQYWEVTPAAVVCLSKRRHHRNQSSHKSPSKSPAPHGGAMK